MTNEVEGERNQHNNDEKEEEEQQQQKMPPMKQRLTQSQMEFFLDYNPITLKAVEYKICSCARPHMRGFHLAWTSFLVAFIAWFSIAPLAPAIKETLGLKKSDLLWANISSVLSTVFARFAVGPVMDHVGPRKSQAFILMFAAIPTCFAGLIQDVVGLCIIRGLIGVAGAAFVGCQFWCTLMFEKEIAGSVNAIAGGWGNLGGGLTQALMVGIFSMNTASPGCDQECGWRNAFFIPAFALMLASVLILFLGDDCPQGHYIPPVVQETTTTTTTTQHAIQSNTDQKKMKRRKAHIADVAGNPQVWALVLQYACCFGMELHVNNTIALYYYDRFGLGITTAGLVASLFGLTNIFARAWGGMISDLCYKHWGMNGRKYSLVCLACSEGVLLIVFSRMPTLPSSITMMVIFSVVVQATEGSTFGIVPYVDPLNSGGVMNEPYGAVLPVVVTDSGSISRYIVLVLVRLVVVVVVVAQQRILRTTHSSSE
mmetsp:Transcript_45638/g.73379  ORF Transcript_45638/g.73379 Transcript_45638/m.73379 type:complete len:484 (-) Transcript_45638:94-1545(-)